MTNIKEALKAAVEQGVSGGVLGRVEFIEQLAAELRDDYGLDVETGHDGKSHFLECEMGKDKTPGFRIDFESRSMALLTPNKFSVSSHGEPFALSRGVPFNMLAEEKGQKAVVEAVGKWLVENSGAELLDKVVPNRQKVKALTM